MTTATAGKILIELEIDDKGVPVAVRRTGASLRELQSTLNQTAQSVKKLEEAHTSLGAKLHTTIATLGYLRFAAMDVNDVFFKLPMSILKSAGELERMQLLMKGLSKELTEVGRSAEGLRDFNYIIGLSKKAPFDIAALSDSFVKLKTAGLDPTKGSMSTLVDSVAKFGGSSEILKRASVAIQQMSGKGVISMEELRQQLGEAIPTAMKDMADGMGVSMAKLANIVKTGTLATGPALGKMFVQMRINDEGAAEAMMKTWGGTLSRLKTEWQLTAAFIASNGFGDAAKEAVGKITAALQTTEFRRFASDAGAALGSTTNSLVSGAESLIKYRSEIATLVEAWIAYKVVFSGIVPIANAIERSYGNSVAAIKREVSSIQESATIKQTLAVQSASSAMYEAQANAAKTAEKIALDVKELESVRIRNAAILAEDARMNAAMAAGRIKIPGSTKFQSKDTGREYLADLSSKNTELVARERELVTAVAASTTALSAKEAAAAKAVTALAGVASVSRTAQLAASAMAAATTAAGTALNLLGGPIGVAIIAITGLVWWYNRAGAAAEESAARQRRALTKVADLKDLAASKDAIADAQTNLKNAEASAKEDFVLTGGGSGRKKTAIERENDAKEIIAASKKLTDASNETTQIINSVRASNSKLTVDAINSSVGDVVESLARESRDKIGAIEANRRALVKGMVEGSDQEVKISKEQNTLKQNLLVKGITARIDAESAAAVKLRESAKNISDGSVKDGMRDAATQAEARAKQLTDEKDTIAAQIAAKIMFKDKGDGAKGRSPFQVMVDNLKIDNARLSEAIDGLMSNAGKVNTVAVAKAKLEAILSTHAKDGTVKDKDGKNVKVGLTDAQKNEARELTVQQAELSLAEKALLEVSQKIDSNKTEFDSAMGFLANPLASLDGSKAKDFITEIAKLKAQQAMLESTSGKAFDTLNAAVLRAQDGAKQAQVIDLAASWKPLIADVQQLGPQYELALQRMANPLETVSESKTAKFDKMIAKLRATPGNLLDISGKILVAASEINGVIEELQRGKKESATIDLSESYKSLVDENRKANIDIIQDDRARTRAQIQSENDLATARAKQHIDNATKAGVEIRLIDQMQTEAAANMLLRAEELRLKTRTPLEKLTDSWKNSLSEMEDAQARWADDAINKIADVTNKGKIDFGSFAKSVLSDILKIQLKSTLGDPIKSITKAATSKLTEWMPNLGSNATAPASSAAQLASSQFASSAAAAFRETERAARSAGEGLMDMVKDGVGPSATALAGSVIKQGEEAIASSAMTSAVTAATSAVYGFTAALQAGSGGSGAGGLAGLFGGKSGFTNDLGSLEMLGSLGFADGGIMSSMGAMSLKKYAAGGIANSPQMAIFGEGDMNEAYVPLPDGRRIPVALSGGGAGGQPASVTVNVINQTGGQVSAQQGQTRFDGKQMILDVVLTAASQPGGFRDGMKGAMK